MFENTIAKETKEKFKKYYGEDSSEEVLKRFIGEDLSYENTVLNFCDLRKAALSRERMISKFIRDTFDQVFIEGVKYEEHGKKAMLVGLREYDDKDFKACHWMLLYCEHNSVYVMYQKTDSIKENDLIDNDWLLITCHDSCYVEGIDSFIRHYVGDLNCTSCAFLRMWVYYDVSDKLVKSLRSIKNRAYGFYENNRDESLRWRPNDNKRLNR